MSDFMNFIKTYKKVEKGQYKSLKRKNNMIFEIKKGTKLYKKELNNYKEVEVDEVFLEKYINGWKTIIKVITDTKQKYTYFITDLGMRLFTELPEENKDGK